MGVGLDLRNFPDRRRAVALLGCPPDLFDRLVPDAAALSDRGKPVIVDDARGTLALHGHRVSWVGADERPSLLARIGSAARVVGDSIRSGHMLAADAVITDRQAICASCADRRGILCGKCGCVIAAKTRLSASKCPLDRW